MNILKGDEHDTIRKEVTRQWVEEFIPVVNNLPKNAEFDAIRHLIQEMREASK